MKNQEPVTMPEELAEAFFKDLFERLVGSTILAVGTQSPTEFWMSTERDGVILEILIDSDDGELTFSEGTLENSDGE